jgi:hypothetical protein
MRSISSYFEATCYAWVGLIGLRPPATAVDSHDDRTCSGQPARRRSTREHAGHLYSLPTTYSRSAERATPGTEA